MILNYIKGYYVLYVSGGMPEKLLNTCAKNNIEILELIHKENGYSIKILKKDYKSFKNFAKKNGCKIQTEKYSYILKDVGKFKYRYLFVAGITFFAAFLFICSQYIWDITIDGNYTYTYDDILDCVNEMGIYDGTLKKQINCNNIEKNIRNTYFDITWVSAEIKGTRLIIHIKENFDNYIVEQEEEPYDIIANKDAKILSIITRSGTPIVKAGDTVSAGDILISGAVAVLDEVGEFARYEYVNSDGDIYAETNYDYSDELSLNYTVNIYTGKYSKSSFLKIFNIQFNTNPFAKKKDNNLKLESFNQIILFRNFYLPLYYGKMQYRYFESEDKIYSEDEIKSIAEDNFNYYIETLKNNDVQIEEYHIKYNIKNNKCYASGNILAIEKIGSVHTVEIIEEEPITENEYN